MSVRRGQKPFLPKPPRSENNAGPRWSPMIKATWKQVRFALMLLGKAGYSTTYMGAEFKAFGATMRERSGTVEGWLRNMNVSECSDLIDKLKARVGEK